MASITKRPNGKWRARYRDESQHEHARHFERKVDAQRWLDSVTASIVRGEYVDPRAGAISFMTFYDSWAERQVWATGTRRPMDLAAGSFPDVRLSSLRRSHFEGWVKAMTERDLAPGTIKTRAQNVRSVLRAAVADQVIPRDPSIGVTLPRTRRKEASMSIPSTEVVGRLLERSEHSAFIAVCAFAGLRLGEAAALRPTDIDAERGVLSVTRQVQRERGGSVEIKSPKAGSERVVFIPDSLTSMLLQLVDAKGRTEWLFADDGENPPHQNTVGHWWRTACKRAGVSYRLHDLRHFYASGLIAAGCDVVTVQRALGHSKATTTLDRYSHLWPTAEDRTRKAAAELLADSLRTTRKLHAV
ncbi:site-specific recombinase XerD [Terracoccus luteus]|uniref:Site-specific recombinase XerD n=1 Tax=Terracoccus luteus TaxID=53356 RepID=A0A495XZE9_9MICO|nr:site-specific integrase [Terracoccus luteus]RKT78679.1 site-specific recombinase XerD [Terracoccus luteus]